VPPGASDMDEMVLWAGLTVVLLCAILYFQLTDRGKLADGAEGLHQRLDVLEDSLKIVGSVLEQLPGLMPSFHLASNPLTQIMEFVQNLTNAMRGEAETPSREGAALGGLDGTEESSDPSP